MGDTNAKVSGDNTGREGLGVMNENGELFADFCGQNDFIIGGTFFKHCNIHKATWKSPDLATHNQIDHIAISRRWRGQLLDVRVQRGADAGSDHEMVLAKIKARIMRRKHDEPQRKRRFDTNKLSSAGERRDLALILQNKFQALANLG